MKLRSRDNLGDCVFVNFDPKKTFNHKIIYENL